MDRKICEECKGKIKNKEVEVKIYGESLGFFNAQVCSQCGEEVFDEETSDKIDEIAKKKGLWGLGTNSKVMQIGSSVAIVINKKIADFMGIKKGNEVYVHPENREKLAIQVH